MVHAAEGSCVASTDDELEVRETTTAPRRSRARRRRPSFPFLFARATRCCARVDIKKNFKDKKIKRKNTYILSYIYAYHLRVARAGRGGDARRHVTVTFWCRILKSAAPGDVAHRHSTTLRVAGARRSRRRCSTARPGSARTTRCVTTMACVITHPEWLPQFTARTSLERHSNATAICGPRPRPSSGRARAVRPFYEI